MHRGGIYQIFIWWIHYSTENGGMIRKWPAEHDWELHPKPKFLVMAKALCKAPSFLQIRCGNFQNGLFRHILKSLLLMKGQKRNRGARKMNPFTSLVELWLYDSRNLCSKKDSFLEHLYGHKSWWLYYLPIQNLNNWGRSVLQNGTSDTRWWSILFICHI